MAAKQVSVLLVEDNKIVRKMSIIVLEQQLKCKVDAVETGKLALEYAGRSSYDIIFMDIGLPDIDGLSVISQIRQDGKLNSRAPIIALTAHSDRQYMEESYLVGANEFLVKPFDEYIGRNILEKYAQYEATEC